MAGGSAGPAPGCLRGRRGRNRTVGHVFLAHPTTSRTALLRRGYSFVDGTDGLGRLDAGLFFIAYQRDPGTGFVQVQRSLRTDAMNEYIRHTSSALFACPPGLRDEGDWWGRTLLGS